MHSRCTSSEGPRSEPWPGGLSWPTCSPGLRSKCPAPALLSVSPFASRLRSIPKQTFTERLPLARHSQFHWFTDGFLSAGGLQSGFKACLLCPFRPGPAPNIWPRLFPLGPRLGGPCFPDTSRRALFCSLAVEEAGLEDPPDSGWRLCLRLHGPLHPEGLSSDGHELPFLFEQVRISGIHAQRRPASLNPPVSGPSHFVVMATPGEAVLEPRPQVPHP